MKTHLLFAPSRLRVRLLLLALSFQLSALSFLGQVPRLTADQNLTGKVAFSGDITPAQITANQNDYNPTGLSGAAVLRLSTDASRNITGLQGGSDGRILIIANVGSFPLVLVNASGLSTEAYRFAFTTDVTLAAGGVVPLIYDSTASRWRLAAQLDLSGTFQPLDAALTAIAGGSDFVTFTGPTTSTKTFTLPNASATLLYAGGDAGTPSALIGTNISGTAAGLTAGTVTTNANLTGDVTSTGNATTIAADAVALGTDTTGNYVATIADSGAGEVTVANSGTENAAVTLAIAASIARDSEVTAAVAAAVSDTAYDATSWNGVNTIAPSKNAVRDQIELLQPLDADLTSIAGNTTGGFLTRTAADTYTARTITGTGGQIAVANGDGVSGAPTISLPTALTSINSVTAASATNLTLNGGSSGASIALGQGANGALTFSPAGTGNIVIAKTATASTREAVLKATLSDSGNDAFIIANGTSGDGTFAPAFAGYVDSSSARWGIQFIGLTSAANDASDSSIFGMIDFIAMRTDSASDPLNGALANIVNRDLFTIRTVSTTYLTMAATGATTFSATTASTSKATGALILSGSGAGLGVDGQVSADAVKTTSGSSTAYANAGGTLYQSTTAVGNITTGVDDLITQTIAANVLATNGDRLRITTIVSFAANANSKQILAKYGATTCYDSTAQTANAGTLWIEVIVTRTGAATQNICARVNSSNASFVNTANFTTAAETLSGAVTFKLTGEAVSTDDIIQRSLLVEYLPAP